jgi:DNA mismatch repair protein MutS2
MGRDRALTAEPLVEPIAIRSALGLTGEARRTIERGGDLPLPALLDVSPLLERVRVPGTVADGNELVSLLPLLDAAPRLVAHGRAVRDVAPGIATLTDRLPRLPELRDAIGGALDQDGAVVDDASPRLAGLRRDVRQRRRRLVQDLERMLVGPAFAERFVTLRHGRYVIPLRAEARGRIRGIVHDRSQSGQTLFVEPDHAVDANNELVELAREEAEEVARILAALSEAVRGRLDDLETLVRAIAELDWIFARASAAERMRATPPAIGNADRGVSLRAARHPLLVAQSWQDPSRAVVPVDIELGAERPLLVITGPNAGGKTVALKTLALSALMAQVGCHIPADDGSRLPLFDSIHAIIGDDQSVAENLSTFSAFVKQVRDILAEAGPGTLVLLDELGAGTDPDEGAALAQAILEALDTSGALVVASTHLEPLKTFATTYPRARNASVEFDAERLAPTFRLRYDRPGQSYALAIAGRLGLPRELIARAEARRSAHAARMSELLRRLDEDAKIEASRALAIEASESEAAARLAAARDMEAKAESRARQVVDRAKAEAVALLADVRRVVNAEWERLRRAERSRRTLDESRRHVGEAVARIVGTPAPEALSGAAVFSPAPGTRVKAEHLGLRGEIVSIAGNTATVRSGSVTVRVPVGALRPMEEPAAGSIPAAPPRTITVPAKHDMSGELHLLGRTTDEARDLVEAYLDDAFLAGLAQVRLVHGKGTGALRKAVRELLATHPLVETFRDGEPGEGGAGATVAQLKVG